MGVYILSVYHLPYGWIPDVLSVLFVDAAFSNSVTLSSKSSEKKLCNCTKI